MALQGGIAGQRAALYAGLHARNRVISILRIGLPALGTIAFLALVVQILLASLASQFGLGQIHFDGNTVAVDTPSYSGVMANGDVYKLSAADAATAVTNLNVIDLTNGAMVLTRPDGSTMTARAAASAFDTITQMLTVPGLANVSDSRGNAGTLQQVAVNMATQHLTATGPVFLRLKDGTTVQSNGLDYSAARTSLWNFGRATVVVPDPNTDPDDDAAADPAAAPAGGSP